jgi:hypothetical protein
MIWYSNQSKNEGEKNGYDKEMQKFLAAVTNFSYYGLLHHVGVRMRRRGWGIIQ